jgi:hypothetical protein
MFIHVAPDEARSLARIPKKFLFPAPGFPSGHLVMGFNDRGECPMLVDNRCTIYADRPRTCRDYDCRIFAATGMPPDGATQPIVAERVRAWVFETPSAESRQALAAARASARFLAENADLFPAGALPSAAPLRALVALRFHALFLEGSPKRSRSEIIGIITKEMAALKSRAAAV